MATGRQRGLPTVPSWLHSAEIVRVSIFDLRVLRKLLACATLDGTLCGPNSVFLRKSESSGPRNNCRGKRTANTAYAPRCCVSLDSHGHVHCLHAIHGVRNKQTRRGSALQCTQLSCTSAPVFGDQQCSCTRSCLALH
jgi:hypothetical protein